MESRRPIDEELVVKNRRLKAQGDAFTAPVEQLDEAAGRTESLSEGST